MVHNGYGVDAEHDHDYYCRLCGHTTDDPVERERSKASGDPSYMAGKLAKADPDAVSADHVDGQPMTDGGVDQRYQIAGKLRCIADVIEQQGRDVDRDDVDVSVRDGEASVDINFGLEAPPAVLTDGGGADFIETEHLGRLEQVAPDQTIGKVQDASGVSEDVTIHDLGNFSPRRIIEALLVAQEDYAVDTNCVLSLVEPIDDGVVPLLLVQESDEAVGGVVVAGRVVTNQ